MRNYPLQTSPDGFATKYPDISLAGHFLVQLTHRCIGGVKNSSKAWHKRWNWCRATMSLCVWRMLTNSRLEKNPGISLRDRLGLIKKISISNKPSSTYWNHFTIALKNVTELYPNFNETMHEEIKGSISHWKLPIYFFLYSNEQKIDRKDPYKIFVDIDGYHL